MEKTLHSDQNKRFLHLLRESRIRLGVTQEELAIRIGMSQSDISKVERGVRRLDVLELRTWLTGLGIPLQSFVGQLEAALVEVKWL